MNFNDLWEYSILNNNWTQLDANNPPTARYGQGAIYAPTINSMLVFSGSSGSSDLWQYSTPTNAWMLLNPACTDPPSRVDFSAVYVSVLNSMFIFGGISGSTYLNDLWEYSISDNYWVQLSPSGSVSNSRCRYGLAYDSLTFFCRI